MPPASRDTSIIQLLSSVTTTSNHQVKTNTPWESANVNINSYEDTFSQYLDKQSEDHLTELTCEQVPPRNKYQPTNPKIRHSSMTTHSLQTETPVRGASQLLLPKTQKPHTSHTITWSSDVTVHTRIKYVSRELKKLNHLTTKLSRQPTPQSWVTETLDLRLNYNLT